MSGRACSPADIPARMHMVVGAGLVSSRKYGLAKVTIEGHQDSLVANGGRKNFPVTTSGHENTGSIDVVAPIVNLSGFIMTHPTAHPDPADFEPDGAWYSLEAADDALYAVEPNHGVAKWTSSDQMVKSAGSSTFPPGKDISSQPRSSRSSVSSSSAT